MRRVDHLSRLTQLFVGLWVYGVAAALQLRSGLGLDPWDVFHQGLAERLGRSIGVVVIAVGALVLLLWIPLRQRPGLGTLANVVLIGTALDVTLTVLPAPHLLALRIGFLAAGIVLGGVATGLYIGAHYGPGPRDGLMTGFARRSGRSIRLVRTSIELTVLAVGWLLGGTIGVGTLAYALAIGPLAQLFLRLFDRPVDCPVVRSVDRSVVLVVEPGQPGGQPLDRHLELGVQIDEGLQPVGQPGQRDLLVATPACQLLDTAVGEVHGCLERSAEGLRDDVALLGLVDRERPDRR